MSTTVTLTAARLHSMPRRGRGFAILGEHGRRASVLTSRVINHTIVLTAAVTDREGFPVQVGAGNSQVLAAFPGLAAAWSDGLGTWTLTYPLTAHLAARRPRRERPAGHRPMARRILVAALAGVLGLLALAAGGLWLAGVRGVCAHEYSEGCVWFGPWQGVNKRGDILINLPESR